MTSKLQNTRNTRIAIRAATMSDLEFALALLRQNDLPSDGIQTQFTELYVIAETEVNQKPIAVVAVEIYGKYGLLRSLAVKKDWQGLGIGGKLITDRIEWSKSKKLKQLFLLTTTAPGYFKRIGFKEISKYKVPDAVKNSGEFAHDCPSSAVVMSQTLK